MLKCTLHKSADPLTSVTGVSLGAMITQVRMVSKPANPETCCTICDQYRIAGVVVCKNFRAKTWHVGAVSYTTCSQIFFWVVFWGYAGRYGIVRGIYSLNIHPFLLWTGSLLCLIPATDGRSPSFEYCANKQQATEATSENCWIFLALKTNYPTNKQTNKQTNIFGSTC